MKRLGYTVVHGWPGQIQHGDILLMWNRYGEHHDLAKRFSEAGGEVIVAENGYAGNDRADRRRYAIARDGHNGSGFWHVGAADRFGALGITLEAPRQDGDHILVCPNRSFGMPGFIMPVDWSSRILERLQKVTRLPIKVRPHPGNNPPKVPLAEDLKGARAVVVWSSSAGVDALIAGVPVFADAPWWICRGATVANIRNIETAVVDPERRSDAMHRLAWAQWHVDEIEQGDPFAHLLQRPCAFGGDMPAPLAG